MRLDYTGLRRIKFKERLELGGVTRRHLDWENLAVIRTASNLVLGNKNSVVLKVGLILVKCVVFERGKSDGKLET